MITKEQLKDWLDLKKRAELITKIEKYIDSIITKKVLSGSTTIQISTGFPDNELRRARTNDFYRMWCNNELSPQSLKEVRNIVLDKYSELFIIKEKMFDEGWNSSFPGISLEIKKDVLEEITNGK